MAKGNSVELNTFKSYGVENILGYKTEERNGRTYVNFVWCKVCARNEEGIKKHPNIRGNTKLSAMAFVKGTNVVTKHQITRHLNNSAGHKIALELEKAQSQEGMGIQKESLGTGPKQPRVDTLNKAASTEAYKKLMRTAYELAMNPSLPLGAFEVMVKCQRENGVTLIDGRHDGRSAKEYITSIYRAVTEKVAVILASKHAMSLLSDGSQARKTNADKELVLVRVERHGVPTYFTVSLLDMAKWGGTGAEALKKAIDSIFAPSGNVPVEDFRTKLISCTADGASVNFGQHTGLLTRFSADRDWLLKIHCANHRVELAVKAVMKDSAFKQVDEFYQSNFNLLKNSGEITSDVRAAAESLGIHFNKLPKITGTRFIGHRVNALSVLLDSWPAFIVAYENSLASGGTREDTKAKIRGLLKNFRCYKLLCRTCCYLDVLEKMRPASMVFEGEGLLPFDVWPSICQTTMELEDTAESAGTDAEGLDSYLAKFRIQRDPEGKTFLKPTFVKAGHNLRKVENREYVEIELEQMTNLNESSRQSASSEKKTVALKLVELLKERFSDFNLELFSAIKIIFDPQYWLDEKDFGVKEIRLLADHFTTTLSSAGFDIFKVMQEWKSFRCYVKAYWNGAPAKRVWEKVLQYKSQQFPNLCLLAEIVISISGSNSSVERAFSTLTQILSERRIKMQHSTMEMLLVIATNDHCWSKEEREELLNRALDIYLSKSRKRKLDNAKDLQEPACKIQKVVVESSADEDDCDSDGGNEFETDDEECQEMDTYDQ